MTKRDLRDATVRENIASYMKEGGGPTRLASFDYCFNYFQSFREEERVAELAAPENREMSCLQLAFYLASWGMLRGSTKLLTRSAAHYISVIDAVVEADPAIWSVDANDYSDEAIDTVMVVADRIRTAFKVGATDTLVTKTMLGIFGCVPALDTRFGRGFGAWTLGRRFLRQAASFYEEKSDVIEASVPNTVEFETGEPTTRRYTRAKMIDMIFFVQGDEIRVL